MKPILGVLIALVTAFQIGAVEPPKPYGATPTPRQVAHQEMELYAFCHFTVDTFTDREWGTGGESETVFNPTAFDANQIVNALKAGGLKGVILTCKHHDGFCLWPSKFTEHSVKNSPWKNGKGDVVAEFAKACKRADMKFGVYLSPWDRNHPEYGRPGYVTYFQSQLRELLTNYGQIFEVWFDGANGGTGYYKGKVGPVESKDVNEHRNIDASKYYEWPTTWQLVRELQPGANMFGGPDCRWVGNERGWAPDPCRATIETSGHLFDFDGDKLGPGNQGGNVWCPAEVDVSIRPGWFWHASENNRVRSPENLMQIYLNSVGHGAMLNLNVPPDRRGILHENDVESLRQFGEHLRATFATDLADRAKLSASNIRGGDARRYGPGKLLDKDRLSAWVTDDNVTTPEVTFELAGDKTFNLIRLREDIRLGLRVEGVAVDAWEDGTWKEIAQAESIGECHLWRVPQTTTDKVRIRVTKSPVCPALSDFGLFLEPEFDTWIPPVGGDPKMAMKAKWKVVSVSDEAGPARNAIDGNPNTLWHTHGPDGEHPGPQDIVVDLGKMQTFTGFTYLPRHDGTTRGIVDQYAFYVSADGKNWGEPAAEGEFGNIKANPVEQTVQFDKAVTARYFKFVAKHSADGNHITVAEIGLVIKGSSADEKAVESTGGGWRFDWSDEFNRTGSPVISNVWRWDGGESMVRDAKLDTSNGYCKDGLLVLEAKRVGNGNHYTTAAISSSGLKSWKYGRFEMRGRIDPRKGSWPAWWTIGVAGGWPGGGEIDMMEYYTDKLLFNVMDGAGKWANPRLSVQALGGTNWSSLFHTWVMEWDSARIDLFLDGTLINHYPVSDADGTGPNGSNPFRQAHQMMLNQAIGATGGDPSGTEFPVRFEVDYVRHWEWVNTNSFALTVEGGSGSGPYLPGSLVSITANMPPNGKTFDKWLITSGKPTIVGATDEATTFDMPKGNVSITATYK